MESGSNSRESKAASGDEAMMISPEPEAAASAPAVVASAGEEEAAVSPPPAPAVASPKPYYECVFCKRGFTTAQALGGHMNIHRRDRAKPAARDSLAGGGAVTTVSRNVECYNKYRHLLTPYPAPAPSSTAAMAIGSSSSSSFGMYYPSTGMAAPVDTECGSSPSSVSPRELSLFGAATTRDHHDLHLGLACHGDSGEGSSSRAPEGSSAERQAGEPAERELDLELRLGRRPRH